MDDEEEIDIIGNDISSGQLLSCDYTVHPNWINENPDGNNFWSDSVPKNVNLESNVEVLHSDEIIIEEPAPVPHIIDSEWTEEQTTSPADLIFEEDIPATIEEIVTNQENDEIEEYDEEEIEEEYDEGEDVNDNSQEHGIYDFEPAAFETHPPDKNIKYIGPTNERSLLKVKIENQSSSLSLLSNKKVNKNKNEIRRKIPSMQKPPSKFKTRLKVNSEFFKINGNIINKLKKRVKQKPQKLKKVLKTRTKQKNIKPPSGKGKKCGKWKTEIIGKNVTISHEAEKKIPENNFEINMGTVIKVDKCDTESDIEIDVEDMSVNDDNDHDDVILKGSCTNISNLLTVEKNKLNLHKKYANEKFNSMLSVPKTHENISNELMQQLKNLNIPTEELNINSQQILEIEKYVNHEFFDGRPTKTPEQYLRIRNHILSMWNSMKPKYVSKTSVRSGLKHGGDVNNISRIHRLLEQIGAINFGHSGKYFEYTRPLNDFISMYLQQQQQKTISRIRNNSNNNSSTTTNSFGVERRQRIRNQRFNSFIESDLANEANYTIIHMDGVTRPDPPQLNANKSVPIYKHIRSEYDLVKCLKFSYENIAPFKVSITLSTLLCLQLHSFSSNHEVMGFLGGYCSKSVGRNKISLTRYKPCRTSQQSSTMCEMCPVSQVEQSSSLGAEGFELLGWFHSHPLFPANPSRTDIQTQKEMQLQFSIQSDRPFIGLILSCLNLAFKCIYIMPKDLHLNLNESGELAYELDVDIIKDCTNFKNDVKDVINALETNCDAVENTINKFKILSVELLSRFGYNSEIFYNNVF